MYDKIKRWYDYGLWTAAMVGRAVAKSLITAAQYQEITTTPYAEQ